MCACRLLLNIQNEYNFNVFAPLLLGLLVKSTTKLVQALQEDVMPFSASRTWTGKGIVTTIALFTIKTAPGVWRVG